MTKQSVFMRKLGSIPMFADLTPRELTEMARLLRYRRYPKGGLVVSQGERVSATYLLVSGRVKVSMTSHGGKQFALSYLDAPTHFGEMSFGSNGSSSVDVVALSEIELFMLEGANFIAAVQLHPPLAVALIANLSQRLRETIDRLEHLAFHDASHRVMRTVLNVATASQDARGAPLITSMTHYEIATLANTSRETASRVISSLAKDGVLIVRGRTLEVDLIRLRNCLGTR